MWLGAGAVLAAAIALGFAALPPASAGSRPAGASGGFSPDGRWLVVYNQWIAENGAFEWPLGASTHLVPSREESHRSADERWAHIVEWNPDAVHPGTEFVSWTTRVGADTELGRCLTAAGFTVKESIGADGEVDGMSLSYSGDSPENSVASFACQLAHPSPPARFWDMVDRELRYYRDVVVPCLDANGFPQEPLPEFDDQLELVIARGYGWSPTLPADEGQRLRLVALCHPYG